MKNNWNSILKPALKTWMCLKAPLKPADFALHFLNLSFYVQQPRCISAIFRFFYLAVRVYAVTVVDSFIYWFLCEAEKKH